MALVRSAIFGEAYRDLWQRALSPQVDAACRVASIDPWADYEMRQTAAGQTVYGNIAAFQALRAQQAAKGKSLTLAASLGGWTKSTHFSGCVATAAGRSSVVQTSLELLERSGFDGIDVDWEYPVCCGLDSNEVAPDDWAKFGGAHFRTLQSLPLLWAHHGRPALFRFQVPAPPTGAARRDGCRLPH